MGTIKADTVTGLADPNKATIPNTITMGSTTATLNFGNTVIANASAGSSTITGEGGSTTTNLQQGLIKVWCTQDGTASNAAAYDSFNVSGTTDNGTGDYTVTINNDMSSLNYSVTSGGGQQTGSIANNDIAVFHKSQQTGQYGVQTTRFSSGNNSTLQENTLANSMVGGDLA